MIENEQSPEEAIGFVHFTNGEKEPIYSVKRISAYSMELLASNEIYRVVEEMVPYSFTTEMKYFRYVSDSWDEWERVYNINKVEWKG